MTLDQDAAPSRHSFDAELEARLSTPGPLATPMTIAGFGRYQRDVRALPAAERSKIDRVARLVLQSLGAIRTVRLVGHADPDTPRRPQYERQVGLARAYDVLAAIASAIDRLAPGLSPPYSSRIDWEAVSVGATQLAVPNPRSEADRARNRRVEVSLVPYPGSAGRAPYRRPSPLGLEMEIGPSAGLLQKADLFCQRVPAGLNFWFHNQDAPNPCVDQKGQGRIMTCAESVGCAMGFLCRCQGAGRCCGPSARERSPLTTGIQYRPPFVGGNPDKCCGPSRGPTLPEPGPSSAYWSKCGERGFDCVHCNDAQGRPRVGEFAVLLYDAQMLGLAVERLKCAVDQGCAMHVEVMSGICDDKPDRSCAGAGFRCPEHHILVIAREGDTFLFWDPASTSATLSCPPFTISAPEQFRGRFQFTFGLLFFDAARNRLSTATTDRSIDGMEVNGNGFHTRGFSRPGAQKRYQVLAIGDGRPFKPSTSKCSACR